MTTERFDVRRQTAAAPAKIFALLSDPSGHVAIDSSGMLQSAEGDRVRAVGEEFVCTWTGSLSTTTRSASTTSP